MTEVVIFGGGPAGASAARLLATWGHRVQLITRPPGHQRLAVSLPPSCAKLFDAIGVAAAIDRAGFIRSTGNTVWWGGDARSEPFADGARGWQVDLAVLEDVLLAEARSAGVSIERRPARSAEARNAKADHTFVLDCTGRTGVVARAENVRRYDDGPKTIALAGEWLADSWPIGDHTHTLVESYGDGWMWSVPISATVRHVCAMVDPLRSELARGGHGRNVYLAEIAKTNAFKNLLAGATLVSGPTGWDASTYGAHEYAGDGWLLIGDAGSFIDPLSSAGVKKAIASAWLAAIAVHTSLETPSMRGHALQFYSAREREIERHYAAESRTFLASAARGHERPFWMERSAEPRPGADKDDSDAVRRTFDELKHASAFRARVSPEVRIEPRPLVEGHEIVLAPHVVPADGPAIRYLYGTDIVTLLELAPDATQVPDLFENYVRQRPPVSLHDFLLALSTALARGWLVSQ
ncbi:MAG TPA: FAD-dependent monooxygenase [Vicinamibacterales bacterium]|nr:FAD-dependent monooxygenase [Vicinamibacterales bacterium]